MIETLEHSFSAFGYGGVFLLLLIANLFPAIPSEVVTPFCGFVAARDELGLPGVIAAAVLGAMTGQIPWYFAGRILGRKRVVALAARYGRWLTVTPHELERVFGWFNRHGRKSVFLGCMIPVIRAVISIPAGIALVPFGRFLGYATAGTTIWMGALATAGYALGENYALVAAYVRPGTKIVIAAVVLIYIVRLILSFRTARAE